MTAPGEDQDGGKLLTPRRLTALGVIAVLIGIVAIVALVWYIVLRPAGPPPIGPGAPVIPEGASAGQVVAMLGLVVV